MEGAKLQVIDKDGTVVEEWISTKEEHVIYGLPEGSYTLHEELAPYEDGYVSASDVMFEVKEDGSVTKVEMKDEYSKVEISKTDLTTGKELEGAKLQIIRKDGTVLEAVSYTHLVSGSGNSGKRGSKMAGRSHSKDDKKMCIRDSYSTRLWNDYVLCVKD